MWTYTVAFLISAFVAFVLTRLVRDAALRFGAVDSPTEARKVHRAPIPRVGGIAIAVAFFLPVIGLYFIDNGVSHAYLDNSWRVIGLFGGSTVMVAVGLVDDLRGLSARTKLAVQIIVALAMFALGYRIENLANPFGDPLALGWFALPVTIAWIVVIMNSINLIDGLDGLAGGVSLFTVLTLFVLAVISGNIVVGLTSIALAGALLGFLRYNFNPASIFMGDSGSLFLGFVLAITAISGSAKSSTVVSLIIPIVALGVPIIDTSIAVLRRFLGGRPLFAADRGHIHHRMLDFGLTQRQAVLALYAMCFVLGIGALALVYANNMQTAIILGGFAVASVVLSRALGYLSWHNVSSSVRYGLMRQQKLRTRLGEVHVGTQGLREADSNEELVDRLRVLADTLDVDGMVLSVTIRGPIREATVQASWMPSPETPAPANAPKYTLRQDLAWQYGDHVITGSLDFWWQCDQELLQLPEAPCYQLIAHVVRDRLLELAADPSRHDVVEHDPRVIPLRFPNGRS